MNDWLNAFRSGTRSLRTQLALYFVPISVVPTLAISLYAIRVYEDSYRENLSRRARVERDTIVSEITTLEAELLERTKAHARSPELVMALSRKESVEVQGAIASYPHALRIRVFSPSGKMLANREADPGAEVVPYISEAGLRRVKEIGETMDRNFATYTEGMVSTVRVLVRQGTKVLGILEEESLFGRSALNELKNNRQVDVVFLPRDFSTMAASFALSRDAIKGLPSHVFDPRYLKSPEAIFSQIGESRYASFLFEMPGPFGRVKNWGYVAVFLSMTGFDQTLQRLRVNVVYLTIFLTLGFAYLIFYFSNRVVRPIEVLVSAMKRVKAGRVEQIAHIEAPYEIEYFVRAFNDMARNISGAKRALELKLEELHRANQEIKNTQGTLVQSAKMISLGQIVAGVAHELNNPIAFIYSNMHHLAEYVTKLERLVDEYREFKKKLPKAEKEKVEKLEREIELEYIIKDMGDITRSCMEGANRTKEIVSGLRTFSRMDESKFRPSDIHEGIRTTLKLLTAEFKNRIMVHEEFGNLPLVECSLSSLNQVFMNLLSNAAQAIVGKGEVWVRTRVDGSDVVIEVEDTGPGISKENLEKIFDPFFTTKKVGEGTGLGLSIAYGLIQKHHGEIHVDSKLGKGTTFTIRLPIQQTGLTSQAG